MSFLNFEELIQHTSLNDLLELITSHAELGLQEVPPDTNAEPALPFRPTVPSQRDPYENSDPVTVRSNQ